MIKLQAYHQQALNVSQKKLAAPDEATPRPGIVKRDRNVCEETSSNITFMLWDDFNESILQVFNQHSYLPNQQPLKS